MKEQVIQLFRDHPDMALAISIGINILVALAGVIPSFFITAANILFFGFWEGIFISFLGEACGAIVSFILYRKGFKKGVDARLNKFARARQLIEAKGREAFLLIFSLRLLPFVPSGLVTFAAAVGNASTLTFIISSSLGKIPALLLEGYSVYQVTQFGWQGKLILSLSAIYLAYLAWKQIFKSRNGKQ